VTVSERQSGLRPADESEDTGSAEVAGIRLLYIAILSESRDRATEPAYIGTDAITWRKEGAQVVATLDWAKCPAVESIPGKVSGAWVLRGTRMPVSAIFENIEAGANIDDIMEWFDGLDREQVKALIEFAARSLDRAPALTP
jgi:uncharacterized protein (DUF433 family)